MNLTHLKKNAIFQLLEYFTFSQSQRPIFRDIAIPQNTCSSLNLKFDKFKRFTTFVNTKKLKFLKNCNFLNKKQNNFENLVIEQLKL